MYLAPLFLLNVEVVPTPRQSKPEKLTTNSEGPLL